MAGLFSGLPRGFLDATRPACRGLACSRSELASLSRLQRHTHRTMIAAYDVRMNVGGFDEIFELR